MIGSKRVVATPWDRWISSILMFYSLTISLSLLLSGVHVTAEDGFYYFKIAQNLALGEGSSFDGLTTTNGYHPLWMFCLVVVFTIWPEPSTALLVGKLTQGSLAAATVVLVYYTARRFMMTFAGVLAALVWIWLTSPVVLSGLEFSLHALLMLSAAYLYLSRFVPAPPRSWRLYLTLGMLLGLLFLSRLDSVLLTGLLGFWLAWHEHQRGWSAAGLRRLLALGLPPLLACLAYAAVSDSLTDHMTPISSAVKRSWSNALLNEDPVYLKNGWFSAKAAQLTVPLRQVNIWYFRPIVLGVFGAALVWVAGLLTPKSRRWRVWFDERLRPCGPFVGYGLLSFLAYSLFYHRGLSHSAWYFVMQPWSAALVVAGLMDYLLRGEGWEGSPGAHKSSLGAGIVFLGLVGGCLGMTSYWMLKQPSADRDNPSRLIFHNAAQWASEQLPSEAIIGSWNSGTLGYLSQRRVINLDGVANSWDYFERKRFDLCRYWDEVGITHVIDVFEGNHALSAVPTFTAYAHCADRLQLVWEDDQYDPSWSLKAYRIRPAAGPSR